MNVKLIPFACIILWNLNFFQFHFIRQNSSFFQQFLYSVAVQRFLTSFALFNRIDIQDTGVRSFVGAIIVVVVFSKITKFTAKNTHVFDIRNE